MKPDKLKEIEFPKCAEKCTAIKILGCGECESVCPEKIKRS